ncbi:hypothetical protein HJC23_013087 [Cyclotella cryptica]|uniref:Uncharacterized protein n=1 Tax=Cyclotella cryptica TaxID=29204 RepID=A0ABD3Q7B9_9STRA|eukprot:CCRYP_008143-RA/>CCRYP_008143-RA protein AED:0.07 eAED:0.07 QI:94/1/1/1/0/0/2/250/314
MPHIARALKSVFASGEEHTDQVVDTSASILTLASFQQRLPLDLFENSSEMYSKASLYLSNLTGDKSQGELFFIATILATVILFVVVLPTYEAFFPQSTTQSKVAIVAKTVPSASSSTTDSLQTIEESEDEDLAMSIEKDEIIELPQQEPVEEMQDILNKSVDVIEQTYCLSTEEYLDDAIREEDPVYDADESEEIADAYEKEAVVDAYVQVDAYDADDKHSDATPVTAEEGLETPTSSPLISPDYVKPLLTKDYVSAPNVVVQKRSSLGKLGKRLSSSRLGFGRKDSSDASVCSTSSMRKLSIRGFGKKRSSGL